MSESVLKSIKTMLGIPDDQDAFDAELILHINSALMNLRQLGVEPGTIREIQNEEDFWTDVVQNTEEVSAVRSYVYLQTRIVFDPPQNSFITKSLEDQKAEYAWRLSVND